MPEDLKYLNLSFTIVIYRKAAIFLSLFLLPFFATTQKSNIKFTHINSEDGLSQSTVQTIIKDKYGFMWFGTEDGLNKYDGYKFTIYRHNANEPNGIGSNVIQTLYEDRKGILWIGLGSGAGLSYYDRNKNNFFSYKHNPKDPQSISDNDVKAIYEDSYGTLWVTTYRGLNILNRQTGKFTHFNSDKNNAASLVNDYVRCIYEDSKKRLWIGTNGGLSLFDRKTKSFKSFIHDEKNKKSISHNDITGITEDRNNNVWIATSGGINMFENATGMFIQYKNEPNNPASLAHNYTYSITRGENGILIATENGLDELDVDKKIFYHFRNDPGDETTISNNSLRTVYVDDKGILWVGVFSGGINKYDKNLAHFRLYKSSRSQGLSSRMVTSFAEDNDGNIWAGTDGGGLNLFHLKTKTFARFPYHPKNSNGISNSSILTMYYDKHSSDLWMGTYAGGVYCYNTKTKKTHHYTAGEDERHLNDNDIYAVVADSKNNIWIGTNNHGVNVLDKKTQTFSKFSHGDTSKHLSVNNNCIRAILEDYKGNIWVGTHGSGISIYNPETKRFRYLDKVNNNLGSDIIYSMFEDSKKNIWIGTMGGGLSVYDEKKNRFTTYTRANGLPNDVINSIQEDSKGFLWLSTKYGISRMDPLHKTFKNYTLFNNLQSYEFILNSGFKATTGEIYFGGINGFNVFNPNNMPENKNVPPVVITDFQLFNKPVEIGGKNSPLTTHISETKEITLAYGKSVFTFEFAALNYTISQQNQYAYMLEGFDKTWNYVGHERKATYTQLDPGTYIFRVKAANNDGLWNEKGTSIKIIIVPPYWQTWWFKLLVAFTIIAGIVVLFRMRMRTIKIKEAELEKQVKERTEKLEKMTLNEQRARREAEKATQEAEKANRAKSIFLATMSHEIRTPMNGVIGTTALLAETSLSEEQRRYTEIIKGSGENLVSVINDILDFSKIESGKMEIAKEPFHLRNCIEEVLDLFAEKTAHQGIELVYEIDKNVPLEIIGDSVRLRQVLLNLIGNAIKFTSHGEVFVHAALKKDISNKVVLGFEVRDTGIGIPENKLSGLFDAFTQVDSSTTRKYGGSGLGLAIAKRLIELMNGTIEVTSEINKGSCFSFTIKTSRSGRITQPEDNSDILEIRGKKVLIVDDNITRCLTLKKQFEQWELMPVIAESAAEALGILSQRQFDVVIADREMPEMNGVQLAEKITMTHPLLPVILLSSIGDEQNKQHQNIFFTTLMKPVRYQELKKVVLRQFSAKEIAPEKEVPKTKLTTDFAKQHPLEILIAEDNPVNQTLIRMIMQKLGYNATIIENGKKAVEQIAEKRFDVVLMDMQMPVMDGLEATAAIRQMNIAQPVIIALTANAMQDDRDACFRAGMDDYISKPIQLEKLMATLERWAVKIRTVQKV